MIFLSKDSSRLTSLTPGRKRTVKYKLIALAMALLPVFLNHAAAAPLLRDIFPQEAKNVHDACSRETAEGMLSLFMENLDGRKDGIIVAGWYLHPDGFAFQIPDGLAMSDKRRSGSFLNLLNLFNANQGAIRLVDPSQENNAYQTNFDLSITSEDKSPKFMQWEEAERAYSSQVERFSLLSFANVIVCGEDGILLSYLAGKSPRVQIQQCIFVKNNKAYIATMGSENHHHSLPDAWQQFDTIYSTLFFLNDIQRQ